MLIAFVQDAYELVLFKYERSLDTKASTKNFLNLDRYTLIFKPLRSRARSCQVVGYDGRQQSQRRDQQIHHRSDALQKLARHRCDCRWEPGAAIHNLHHLLCGLRRRFDREPFGIFLYTR